MESDLEAGGPNAKGVDLVLGHKTCLLHLDIDVNLTQEPKIFHINIHMQNVCYYNIA